MPTTISAAKSSRLVSQICRFIHAESFDRAIDGLMWLRARQLFQRSGLFAALPLTGTVLEVQGGRGHLAEAAVHHIPNRRSVVVDLECGLKHRVDQRVRRRKFHRVCAPPDRLPFRDGAFDAAWISFAFARLEPGVQDLVAAEMRRVVRPGGTLIALERMSGARHSRSAADWCAVLSRNGWEIETERRFDSLVTRAECRALIGRAV